ncbi:MAG: hypothetical protein ACJ77M_14385 [Thermoleophilaceae bacterium]
MQWTRRAAQMGIVTACLVLAALAAGSAAADPAGKTTLTQTIRIAPGTGFHSLVAGPGEPFVTRQGPLGKARKSRAGKRRSLLYFGQVTDVHTRDEMAPARIEFADAVGDPLKDANRPQEAFSTQVFDQMIRNIDLNRRSPVKQGNGKRDSMRFLLSTGDDTDSQQTNELGWFMNVLKGGTVDPFSGKLISASNPCPGQPQSVIDKLNNEVATRKYTGLQDYSQYSAPQDRYSAYWDPNQAPPAGGPFAAYPRYPGLLDRAQTPFSAIGIKVPFYDVRGNHDGLAQGVLSATAPIIRGIDTGCTYLFPSASFDPASLRGVQQSQLLATLNDPAFQQKIFAGAAPVPPDPDRRYYDTAQFRAAHGSGLSKPITPDRKELKASDGAAGYYAFTPRKGFRFIALDTVAEGGGSDGNLDNGQYKWLKRELDRDSAVKWVGNKLVRTGHPRRLIVLTSHHALSKMNNATADEKAGPCTPAPGPAGCDRDPRKSTPLHLGTKGKQNVRDLLLQYPDVIAWVDGHEHTNRVTPYVQRHRKTGFWDINTTSHTDFPEQSRLIDVMDNRDGTLSLFGTILDSAAPIDAPAPGPAGSFDTAQIASISRLIAANDYQGKAPGVGSQTTGSGTRKDRNVELLIRDPRRLRGR